MAETDIHRKLLSRLTEALELHFSKVHDVYVSGNLLLYYVEGNPAKRVAPDVFVVRGVHKGDRRIYKLWEERQPPGVIIELTSRETWRDDLHTKWRLYEQLGVQEYFIFDPEYDYLPEPLLSWRLEEKQYIPVEVIEGRVKSEVLGLDLVDTGKTLRLSNPRTEQYLRTHAEAEAEIEILREELNRLRQN